MATDTAKTVQIVDAAAESMMFAFEGVPSESAAVKWLIGYWGMNVEMNGNDRYFDGFEDFCAAVASKF